MNIKPILLAVSCSFLLVACNDKPETAAEQATPKNISAADSKAQLNMEQITRLLNTNADIALAAYSDAVDTAIQLQSALKALKETPTQDHLNEAKHAWLVAREPYGQTEVYRFRLSPIDSTNYQDEDGPEGHINAWPLGEALIDYVVTGSDFGEGQLGVSSHSTPVNYPQSNIIQSDIAITPALLEKTVSAEDERDVLAGYHAIEFLLWGQDLNKDGSADTTTSRELSTSSPYLNSGGHRPLTDFTTDKYAARRHQYLEVASAKLVDDLSSVKAGWEVGAGYRSKFTSPSNSQEAVQRLTEILTGMGTLSEGELAGERIQIAFSSNSQEDEHSCFSDNTHRDIWLNAEGIANSYYGDYAGYDSTLDGKDNQSQRAVKGYGFDDLLADSGLNALASQMEQALAATEHAYKAVDSSAREHGKPVDVLIMDVNRNKTNPLYATILTLNAQSSVIAKIASKLGIAADVVEADASECNTKSPDTSC